MVFVKPTPPSCSGEGGHDVQDDQFKMRELNRKAMEQYHRQEQAIAKSILSSVQETMFADVKADIAKGERNHQAELARIGREMEDALKAIQREKDEGLAAERVKKEKVDRLKKESGESQAKLTTLQSILVGLGQMEVAVSSSSNGSQSNTSTSVAGLLSNICLSQPNVVLAQELTPKDTLAITPAFSTPSASRNLPTPITSQPTHVVGEQVSCKPRLLSLALPSIDDQQMQPVSKVSSTGAKDAFHRSSLRPVLTSSNEPIQSSSSGLKSIHQGKQMRTGTASSPNEDAQILSLQTRPSVDALGVSNSDSTSMGALDNLGLDSISHPIKSIMCFPPQRCSEVANGPTNSRSNFTSLSSSQTGHTSSKSRQKSDSEPHPLPPQKRLRDATPSHNAPASKKVRSMPKKVPRQTLMSIASSVTRMRCLQLIVDGQEKSETRELQSAQCSSSRYKGDTYSKCIFCTGLKVGDTCRFRNIRYFVRNKADVVINIGFINTARSDEMKIELPVRWNSSMKKRYIHRTKIAIARVLLPILEAEVKHVSLEERIHRSRESGARTTCDTCLTSLFSGTWMCCLCGREACADCFAKVKELTTRPDTTVTCGQQTSTREHGSEQTPQPNSFLNCLSCTPHSANDFMPMSRFTKAQLSQATGGMLKLLKKDEDELDVDDSEDTSDEDELDLDTSDEDESYEDESSVEVSGSKMVINPVESYPHPRNSDDMGRIPSHRIRVFSGSGITESAFLSIWTRGEPLVVTKLLSKSKLAWTPEYFIEHYGSQSCTLVEYQTETYKYCFVREFFTSFGNYGKERKRWELKDWWETLDFQTIFTALCRDLNRAVPLPDYVRPNGVLNIVSHFPLNIIPPKLGPVINSALASSTAAGSKGSIRLRMNMADTVSIMTFSSLKPDGTEGCAAWDIFRSEDSDKIRSFLRSKASQSASSPLESRGSQPTSSTPINNSSFPTSSTAIGGSIIKPTSVTEQDPIHSEQNYLDDELRYELWHTMGVKSYRFYQTAGEAVFVPAGCAYQVCNLSDCINVAVGFVSLDSIRRCEQVTREFREQVKMDTLQLRTAMWFAWLNCIEEENTPTLMPLQTSRNTSASLSAKRRFLAIN